MEITAIGKGVIPNDMEITAIGKGLIPNDMEITAIGKGLIPNDMEITTIGVRFGLTRSSNISKAINSLIYNLKT